MWKHSFSGVAVCAEVVARTVSLLDESICLAPGLFSVCTLGIVAAGAAMVFAVREILPINGPAELTLPND